MNEHIIPRFRNAKTQNGPRLNGSLVRLEDIADEIKYPEKPVRDSITIARTTTNPSDKKNAKLELPAWRMSSASTTLDTLRPQKLTGYLCLDVDKASMSPVSIDNMKATVALHPSTVMAFLSPSGNGLKIIVNIHGRATSPRDFDFVYNNTAYLYSLLLGGIPIVRVNGPHFDPAMRHPQQLTFASWDEEPYINLDAEPVRFWPSLPADYKMLVKLDPESYDEWAGHGVPRLKRILTKLSEELAFQAFINFSKRGGNADKATELRRKWNEDFSDVEAEQWQAEVDFHDVHPRALLEVLSDSYGMRARYNGDFSCVEMDFDMDAWPDAKPGWHEVDPERDIKLVRGRIHETAYHRNKRYLPTSNMIDEALKTAPIVHPLRDYLLQLSPPEEALEDPSKYIVERISNVLGLERTELNNFVALAIPCAMVMYALHPSKDTLCDVMPVLIGKQGAGKGLFCGGLLPHEYEHYVNTGLSAQFRNEADFVQACEGRVLVVCDELVGMSRSTRSEFRILSAVLSGL